MEWLKKTEAAPVGETTKKRALTDNILILYLGTLALIFMGQVLGILMILPLGLLPYSDVLVTLADYLLFLGVWVVALLYLRFTKKNRPILRAAGRKAGGSNGKLLLIGFGVGFGLNAVCVLAAWLHGDIVLTYVAFRPLALIAVFVAVFVQSSAEELLCRGFLYQRLRRGYRSPLVAIIGNSLLFALLHLLNDGVTVLSMLNIFASGILFSLMVWYLDSLWCAMAAHAAWNFTQNILFGLPNSGMTVPFSVFRLDTAAARNSFAYNKGFGLEGTLFANLILIAASAVLCLWGRKHGKKPLDVWDEVPAEAAQS